MNKKRVIYVDDDENCLELFFYTFSKSFDITLTDDVANINNTIRKGCFDAVITDFDMPDHNGLDLLKTIKSEFPSLPVIFFTGQGSEEVARNAFLAGASDYFIKEFDGFACKERLINSINNAIEKSLAEKGKKESDKKLRAIIENTPDLISRIDKDFRIVYITPNIYEYTGYQDGFYLGKTLYDTGYSKKSVDHFIEELGKVFRTGLIQEGEVTLSVKKGFVIINYRLIPEFDQNRQVSSIMCIARDITAQKKIEQDYKILFEKMNNGFALMEALNHEDGIPYDFRFMAVNPAFERLFELKATDIIGKTTNEVHSESENFWFDAFKNTATTSIPVFFVHYLKEFDRYLEVNGYRTGINQFAIIVEDATYRIKAEIALRRREEDLRSYLENAPDVVVVLNNEGKFIQVNRAACHMTGYSREELMKMSVYDILPKDYLLNVRERTLKLLTEGSLSGELLITRKDDTAFYAAFEVVRIKDNAILGFCKNVSDYRNAITELSIKEQALLENERILQKSYSELNAVFEAFPGIIQIIDSEFNIINASQRLLDASGYKSLDEVKGKKCYHMWKRTGLDCDECEVAEVLQSGKTKIRISTPEEAEKIGMWFNSYIAPVRDNNGKIIGAIECLMDITELKKTQDALKENEKKMKKIIDNASEGIVEIDKDYKLTFVNRTVLSTLGYSKEEYIGASLTKFVFPEDLPMIVKHMKERATGRSARYKVKLRAKDGTPYWTIAIATPFLDDSGNFKGTFVVFVDINERTKQRAKKISK